MRESVCVYERVYERESVCVYERVYERVYIRLRRQSEVNTISSFTHSCIH